MSLTSINEYRLHSPKVSIGIPTYNRSYYIKEAIDSVLKQTYINLEIIVSNNCSTDDTKNVLSSYSDERIVVLNQEKNFGLVNNFNFCLNRATGDYFLLLSDDDLLESNAIERLLLGFHNESVSISYGPVWYIDEKGQNNNRRSFNAPRIEQGNIFLVNTLKGARIAYPCATMFKTTSARKVNGYPQIGPSTDFGILALLAVDNSVYFNVDPIAKYRIHSQSESISEKFILSYQKFLEWSRSSAIKDDKLKTWIHNYINQQIYRWGRHHALRGNKEKSILAQSLLDLISPNLKWKFIFLFLNSRLIKWSASIKRRLPV
jgi:glycosyltransferase involved in cell wall biosynthesis